MGNLVLSVFSSTALIIAAKLKLQEKTLALVLKSPFALSGSACRHFPFDSLHCAGQSNLQPSSYKRRQKKRDTAGFYSEIMDDEIQLNCQREKLDEECFTPRSC